MPKDEHGLEPHERAFVTEYINNGYVGKRAYLAIRDHVTPETAANEASKLLKKTEVQDELARREKKNEILSVASKEHLIEQADRIGMSAETRRDYGSALKSVELKGKLNRVFTDSSEDVGGYKNLLQQLNVGTMNVTVNPKEEQVDNVIDITEE